MPSTPVHELGRFKTWHVTSVLTPTSETTRLFTWYARESQCIDKVTGPIAEVRSWIENLVSSVNKPDSISFISFRFSRTDVTTWMSNATAQTPLPDLHFEGYIQSKTAIALHCLHKWIPDAIWNNIGGKLFCVPHLSTVPTLSDFCVSLTFLM